MSPADLLLALPFAGLPFAGLRSPWGWAAGAALLWGALFAARRRLQFAPLAVWLPWLGWAALSAAFSGQPALSAPALARWAGVLAFGAAAAQLWGEKERRRWVAGLLGASVALGVAGLFTGGAAVWRGEPGNAMTGLLPPYYNYTAFVEAAAFAASAALLARGGGFLGLRRWALGLLLAGTGGWLVLARSRGALIAAVVGAAVPALLRRGRVRALLPAAGALALAGLLATGLMMARGVAGPAYLLKPERARAFKRPQLWLAAAQAAADHPLLGDGPGQFEKGFRRHVFPAGFGAARYWFTSDHAHSEPLELAVETGAAGAALFLAALAMSALGPMRASAEGEAALAAAAAMGAQCLVDNMLHVPSLALLFFGALACAREGRKSAPERWAPKAWAAAAAVGLAAAALSPLPGALVSRWSSESGSPAERLARARRWAALAPREPGPREAWARALMAAAPPDYAGAAEEVARASRLAPFNAFYLVWRAELLRALGRWPEVEPLARRALELEPNFLQARLLLAEAQARSGRAGDARRELADVWSRRAALERGAEGGSQYARTVVSFDAGRFEAVGRLAKAR